MADLQVVKQLNTPNITLAKPQQQPNITIAPRPGATPSPEPGKLTKQQFAQSIKQKYPQYAQQPDDKLADAFLAKYPQYADKVSGAALPQSQATPEQPGFFKGLAQGIAKPFLRTAATVGQLGQGVGNLAQAVGNKITGDQAGYQRNIQEGMAATDPNREFNFGALGQGIKGVQLQPGQGKVSQFFPTAQSALDTAGVGAELGSFFVGGGAAKGTAQSAFKNALLQSTLKGAAGGAASGGIYGLGTSLQDQQNLGLGNTVSKTLGGAALGGLTGGVLGAGGTLLQRGVNKALGRPLPPKPSSTGFLRSETGQGIMGTDVAEAAAKLSENPQNVRAFQTGQKTFETIANSTRDAVEELQKRSKGIFDTMTNSALVGKKVPKLATQKAALAGVPKSQFLNDTEKPIINKLRSLVMSNKNWTDKGVLALRQRIDRAKLFREGSQFASSNRAVTEARNALNGVVTKDNPTMKKALENATIDIDLIDKLEKSLIGNNSDVYVERTASKLATIMNKLDDPTQFDATRKLIQELEDRTGISILPDLEAAHAASVIKNKTEYPGLRNLQGTLGTFLNRRALKGVERGAVQRQQQKGAGQVADLLEQIRRQ